MNAEENMIDVAAKSLNAKNNNVSVIDVYTLQILNQLWIDSAVTGKLILRNLQTGKGDGSQTTLASNVHSVGDGHKPTETKLLLPIYAGKEKTLKEQLLGIKDDVH